LNYAIKIMPTRDNVSIPSRGTPGASGMDLYSGVDLIIPPGETKVIPLGFAIEIPPSMEGQIRPRSSLSKLGVLTHFGTVDSDYR